MTLPSPPKEDRSTRDERGQFTGSRPTSIPPVEIPTDKGDDDIGGDGGVETPPPDKPASQNGSGNNQNRVTNRGTIETQILERILQAGLPILEEFIATQKKLVTAQTVATRHSLRSLGEQPSKATKSQKQQEKPLPEPPRVGQSELPVPDDLAPQPVEKPPRSDMSDHDFSKEYPNRAGSKLRGVILHRANFEDTNWEGSDLRAAELQQARFSGACLAFVDLRDANLEDADLTNADLHGVQLHKAKNVSKTQLKKAKTLKFATLDDGTLAPFDESRLRDSIASSFSLGELRNLCHDVGINHQDLPDHDQRPGLVRGLLDHCERYLLVSKLVQCLEHKQDRVNWLSYAMEPEL